MPPSASTAASGSFQCHKKLANAEDNSIYETSLEHSVDGSLPHGCITRTAHTLDCMWKPISTVRARAEAPGSRASSAFTPLPVHPIIMKHPIMFTPCIGHTRVIAHLQLFPQDHLYPCKWTYHNNRQQTPQWTAHHLPPVTSAT
ncbi:hypothetical protein H257_07870 [Aphanomyces astaci]|uniref:Uncharacterized protein n=1 Tax=Aphanomyces astaci TaxID=112090 RepID=W4GHG8_APHAT|nr:hypothetical protein H257_07870 [Aphanomyces astaci]ETV79140.1 hypothetical protein H257_07870 [Aphanomyces astaci]|eukprot:XP_009831859.1 hypothetical protein H257_07870 [Aphanomyces astaci]